MDTISGLVRIFLDPIGLGVGVVVVWITMVVLERLYREKDVSSVQQYGPTFMERFVISVKAAEAFHNSKFQATAGRQLDDFFDTDKLFMTTPNILEEISSRLVEALKKYPSAKVCFIEKDSGPVGMLAVESLIAGKLGRPISTIRPRRDIWKMALKGAFVGQGDQVILVQDVVTSGFQMLKPIRMLEKFGAQVVAAVVLFDREEPRDPEFLAKNIDLIPIITRCELKRVTDKLAES